MNIRMGMDGVLIITAIGPTEVYALRAWEGKRKAGKSQLKFCYEEKDTDQLLSDCVKDMKALVDQAGKDWPLFKKWQQEQGSKA